MFLNIYTPCSTPSTPAMMKDFCLHSSYPMAFLQLIASLSLTLTTIDQTCHGAFLLTERRTIGLFLCCLTFSLTVRVLGTVMIRWIQEGATKLYLLQRYGSAASLSENKPCPELISGCAPWRREGQQQLWKAFSNAHFMVHFIYYIDSPNLSCKRFRLKFQKRFWMMYVSFLTLLNLVHESIYCLQQVDNKESKSSLSIFSSWALALGNSLLTAISWEVHRLFFHVFITHGPLKSFSSILYWSHQPMKIPVILSVKLRLQKCLDVWEVPMPAILKCSTATTSSESTTLVSKYQCLPAHSISL